MKARNYSEAWTIAREIFPTPLQKDESSSQRAGYSVYRSTDFDRYYCYICDLGDRLEINLDDGRTINIWIRPAEDDDAEEINEAVKASETARKHGQHIRAHRITNQIKLEFCIDGEYGSEAEKVIYKALKNQKTAINIIYDLATAYCDANGIKWASMEAPKATHYYHGKPGDDRNGHYITSCMITTRAEMERDRDDYPTQRTPNP